MKRATEEVKIPDEAFEEAKGVAQGGNRAVDSVLQDGLVMVFDTSDVCGVSMESLEDFSDEYLWKIVNHPLTWAKDSPLRELVA